jgi:pyridoxal biosynthesis lyase PdxS
MTRTKAEQDRYTLPGSPPTDEDLRHEAELTRAEIGETVAALRHRADVKARLREAAQHRMALLHDAMSATTDRAHRVAGTVRAHPVLAAGGVATIAAALVMLTIWS